MHADIAAMSTRARWLVAAAVAGAALVVGGLSLPVLGLWPAGETVAHPPCSELPTAGAAEAAIAAHTELTDAVEAGGADVRVGQPCGDADAALVEVTVATDEQRDAAHTALTNGDGFGVPAILVER